MEKRKSGDKCGDVGKGVGGKLGRRIRQGGRQVHLTYLPFS